MPIVGYATRFAVEYDLDQEHGGEWMLGRFCYWCNGRRLGDFELGTSLRDVLFQLDEIAKFKGNRANQRFGAMPSPAAFQLLDDALFQATDFVEAHLAEDEQWARHKIIPSVDVFDRLKGFLIEDDHMARFIFAEAPYTNVAERLLKPGELDAVLDDVRLKLNGIHEQEAGRQ
ncbi:Imm42 family immunity protein [Variovorax sp. KK3]|uniref:Imm42 family immunity protein n=1 Tax=Variovorax sp. KK3 TaxID=1855728 RepID=UPI00097C18E4|nr:Imm42 family immunity protein [Variovorax sp. KK3]